MNSKRSYLFVLPDLSGGGAERVTLNLISSLRAQHSLNVDLFLFNRAGELYSEASEESWVLSATDINTGGHLVSSIRALVLLIRASRSYDAIVGALEHKSIIISAICSVFTGKPLIAWVHKDLAYYYHSLPVIKRFVYRPIVSLVLRRASKIVGVSNGVADSIKSLFPNLSDNVHAIYNPVETSKLKFPEKLPLPAWALKIYARPVVIAVGRLEWQKGFDLLIRAHEKCLKRGSEHNLLILGDGSLCNELKILADNLGVSDSVFMPGFQNPLPFIEHANMLALSSRYEGLPTVIIEAMSLNRWVVALDCPSGPRELLAEYNKGSLVPEGDVDSLADSIATVLGKSDDDVPVSFLEQFSYKVISRKWVLLLSSVG